VDGQGEAADLGVADGVFAAGVAAEAAAGQAGEGHQRDRYRRRRGRGAGGVAADAAATWITPTVSRLKSRRSPSWMPVRRRCGGRCRGARPSRRYEKGGALAPRGSGNAPVQRATRGRHGGRRVSARPAGRGVPITPSTTARGGWDADPGTSPAVAAASAPAMRLTPSIPASVCSRSHARVPARSRVAGISSSGGAAAAGEQVRQLRVLLPVGQATHQHVVEAFATPGAESVR
jgi:hypothetical protein